MVILRRRQRETWKKKKGNFLKKKKGEQRKIQEEIIGRLEAYFLFRQVSFACLCEESCSPSFSGDRRF